MKKCQGCGSTARNVPLEYYVEDLLGIRVGIANSVSKLVCDSCTEEIIMIPDVDGLIAAAAVARTMIPIKLNGTEIKFLRKAIDLSAKDFAGILSVRPESVSRWENDSVPMGVSEEKVLRILVGLVLKGDESEDKAPAVDFNQESILKMNIKPFRNVNGKPLVTFERVKVKIKKGVQQSWGGTVPEAA